ncbi:S-adenosyl-L-methionine-dependent methyltransferase [Lophiotrema nucula]|uniref:tRNA (adenine(58)-N(1))-methyltransferase catalytic subunit TRM61 n=1 Tax=Lophiotrema nucula TaxID=690887 RepID=A0A6A5YSE5_9PLEO|nr:S-adenosyl-L-methionine-dependent methyltransferase [Lophiotrema nucula]
MRISSISPRAVAQSARIIPKRHLSTSPVLRRAFEDGDYVLLRDKKDASSDGTLIKLRAAKITVTHRGKIQHDDIIGSQKRQIVNSSKGTAYRIHEPTLAEYVRLTPRIVTPIYPSDANLIVSLLDIHVDTCGTPDAGKAPFEILEAGTGHGALTLHLSRAIHAANLPLPQIPHYADTQEPEDAVYLGESLSDLREASLDSWKQSRCAVVHTLDIARKHSKHAEKVVRGFRNGVYARNVDFHVGDVSEWIASQKVLRQSDGPFLSHVFLDLPSADRHIDNVASALHVDGFLAVFNPSITQITECVEKIREEKLPYLLDQVVELGAGTIRQWDVRAVRPRMTVKTSVDVGSEVGSASGTSTDAVEGQVARDNELAGEPASKPEKWAMVCRPKVGEMVIGGGFLALWRRMEQAPKTAS